MLLTTRFCRHPARSLTVHLTHKASALSSVARPGEEDGRDPSPSTPPRSFRQSTGAWLEEALAKTPKNDLSDQKTFSNYRHPTVCYLQLIFISLLQRQLEDMVSIRMDPRLQKFTNPTIH